MALGQLRPGLDEEAAKRGLCFVSHGYGARAGVRFLCAAPSAVGIPVLDVVAGDDAAVAAAIDAGADDAVPQSASDGLIAARLAALVRRTPRLVRLGPLEIDRIERRVSRSGRALGLLPREYRLLLHLAEHVGHVVPHDELRRAVWGLAFHPGTNVVAVHVSRLRAKLDRGFAVPLLHTENGVGYRLAVPESAV